MSSSTQSRNWTSSSKQVTALTSKNMEFCVDVGGVFGFSHGSSHCCVAALDSGSPEDLGSLGLLSRGV